MAELIGVDIDLRRCHAWSNTRGRLCYNADLAALTSIITGCNHHTTVLVECSSPHIYNIKKAALYNKLRWMCYNQYALGYIFAFWYGLLLDGNDVAALLCSPSSTWKHSMSEKVMMEVLDITGDNHDIRQCRAMVAMYKKHPEDWKPVEDYMEKL